MKALRELPWWFVVAMLIGLASIGTGIALAVHGLGRQPRSAAQVTQAPEPTTPALPAAPPQPDLTVRAPVGRPRSTLTRPAASGSKIPTPFRSTAPATALPSPSSVASPAGSPGPCLPLLCSPSPSPSTR